MIDVPLSFTSELVWFVLVPLWLEYWLQNPQRTIVYIGSGTKIRSKIHKYIHFTGIPHWKVTCPLENDGWKLKFHFKVNFRAVDIFSFCNFTQNHDLPNQPNQSFNHPGFPAILVSRIASFGPPWIANETICQPVVNYQYVLKFQLLDMPALDNYLEIFRIRIHIL